MATAINLTFTDMMKFDEFYRTIGDLKVDQEAYVYEDGKTFPCMKFKKCEEYGRQFVLVYDCLVCEFGIVQDTEYMSFSSSLLDYYVDLCDNTDDFHISVSGVIS